MFWEFFYFSYFLFQIKTFYFNKWDIKRLKKEQSRVSAVATEVIVNINVKVITIVALKGLLSTDDWGGCHWQLGLVNKQQRF